MTQDAFTPYGQELRDFAGHLQLNCSIRSMVRVSPPAFLREDTHTLLHSLGSGCLVPSMGATKQTGLVLGRKAGWEEAALGNLCCGQWGCLACCGSSHPHPGPCLESALNLGAIRTLLVFSRNVETKSRRGKQVGQHHRVNQIGPVGSAAFLGRLLFSPCFTSRGRCQMSAA